MPQSDDVTLIGSLCEFIRANPALWDEDIGE